MYDRNLAWTSWGVFCLFALATAVSGTSQGPPPNATLHCIVLDETGGAIDAHVWLRWDSSGSTVGLDTNVGSKEMIHARTDADGNIKLDLPPGFYDVFVSADAYTPKVAKIRLMPGRGQKVTFKLKPDKLVFGELGTEVFGR